jgi:hypothetical protein
MATLFRPTEGRELNSTAIARSLATIALGRRTNSAHLLPYIRLIAVAIVITPLAVSARQSPPATSLRAGETLAGAQESASRRRHLRCPLWPEERETRTALPFIFESTLTYFGSRL